MSSLILICGFNCGRLVQANLKAIKESEKQQQEAKEKVIKESVRGGAVFDYIDSNYFTIECILWAGPTHGFNELGRHVKGGKYKYKVTYFYYTIKRSTRSKNERYKVFN